MRSIIFISSLLLLFSCSEFNKRKNNETWATGKPGQVLVVCTDHLWMSAEMDSLLLRIAPPEPPFFPLEYAFQFSHRNVLGFTSNFKSSRNIMIVEIHDSLKTAYDIQFKQNKWVKGQTVIQLYIQSQKALNEVNDEITMQIQEAYEKGEIQRYVTHYKSKSNGLVKDIIQQKFGCSIDFPKGVSVLNNVENFLRIDVPDRSREMPLDGGKNYQTSKANFILSSTLFWTQDFENQQQFELRSLLAHQDSMLKRFAPHEKEGAYFTTEYDTVVYPIIQKLNISGVDVYEIKGHYRIGGRSDVFMGGPFVSYSFHVPQRNQIVSLFGMVHGPSERLLTYLREHKSLIHTLSL